jgi:branched-chain amino acid transport system permease protein
MFKASVRKYLVFLVIMCLIPIFIKNPYLLQVITLTILFAYLALAWNLVGGLAGQVSYGHAIFLGVGAYTSTLLFIRFNITPWLGMLIGGLLAVIVAFLLGWVCFRLRGAYFSLASLALASAVYILVMNTTTLWGFDIRGAAGIVLPLKGNAPSLFQFSGRVEYYYIALIYLVVLYIVNLVIRNSKTGLFLKAVASDEDAAKALGVDIIKYKNIVFVISAFFTALGGTFYAQYLRFIDPASVFGFDRSLEIILMSTVGGIHYSLGPIIGAFILQPINETVRVLLGGRYIGVHRIIYGLALILVIRFLPGGLCSISKNINLPLFHSKTSEQEVGR